MNQEPSPAPTSWIKSITAAITTISTVGIVFGLSLPLLSLEMERQGISTTLIGLNVAISGVASLVFAPFVPKIAQRIGVNKALIIAIVTSSVSFLAYFYAPSFWLWFPIRFVAGMCGATLFVLSEFWISAMAPSKKRGLIMGIYASFLSIGFASGPFILFFVGTTGLVPYLTGSVLILLSAIPVLHAWNSTPSFTKTFSNRFLPFLFMAPIATSGALLFGALETGSFSLLSVYGIRLGFDEKLAVILPAVMTIGNVALQVPIGLLSDLMDRRWLLLSCALIGLLGALLLPILTSTSYILLSVLFLWGGITGALYTVGLAHLSARFTGHDLVNANSAFVFCYSLGVLIGPAFLGSSMNLWDPHGFAFGFVLLFIPYILICIWRIHTETNA